MGKDEGLRSDPVSICVFFSFWAWSSILARNQSVTHTYVYNMHQIQSILAD
jgi:hypothetical protein